MNPMYQAMMAQDPMAAQQQQMGYYHPLQAMPPASGSPMGGLGQGMGMGLNQMMSRMQGARDKRIDDADSLAARGGLG